MDPVTVLIIIILVLGSVACGFAIRALILIIRAVRSLQRIMDAQVTPLLGKADVTVDAVNAEILRIDAIITSVEETSFRVSNASNTIHDIVNAPAELVTGVADRVRKAWKDRRRDAGDDVECHVTNDAPSGQSEKNE